MDTRFCSSVYEEYAKLFVQCVFVRMCVCASVCMHTDISVCLWVYCVCVGEGGGERCSCLSLQVFCCKQAIVGVVCYHISSVQVFFLSTSNSQSTGVCTVHVQCLYSRCTVYCNVPFKLSTGKAYFLLRVTFSQIYEYFI